MDRVVKINCGGAVHLGNQKAFCGAVFRDSKDSFWKMLHGHSICYLTPKDGEGEKRKKL